MSIFSSRRSYYRSSSMSGWLIAAIVAAVALVCTWLQMWAWWVIVPDVLSGMVSQGLLPESLTFWQAFKMEFAAAFSVLLAFGAVIAVLFGIASLGSARGLVILAGAVVVVIILTWAQQWCWSIIIPDVFGGMVRAEMLPAELGFWQAFKITFIPLTLGLIGRSLTSSRS